MKLRKNMILNNFFITDNTKDNFKNNLGEEKVLNYSNYDIIKDLDFIANKTIGELNKTNLKKLIIYPSNIDNSNYYEQKVLEYWFDNSKSSYVFKTNNIMGFLGINNSTFITIHSRFSQNNDFFLFYLLQRTGLISVSSYDAFYNHEKIFYLFFYFFPYLIKTSFKKGIFKCYEKKYFNDLNLKGTIDFSNQIQKNYFPNKIAYQYRTLTYDNIINHLIRHTFEFLYTYKITKNFLKSDKELNQIYLIIKDLTPNYDPLKRNEIINLAKSYKSINIFFKPYLNLKEICIKILNKEKTSPSSNQSYEKVSGILFDGAWLWEEYLNKIIGSESNDKIFNIHPSNILKNYKDKLWIDGQRYIYPDFLDTNNRIVADAKYKFMNNWSETEDFYQIITYVYRYDFKLGLFIYPEDFKDFKKNINNLDQIPIEKIGLKISNAQNYNDFKKEMNKNENELIDRIKTRIGTIKNKNNPIFQLDNAIIFDELLHSLGFSDETNKKIRSHAELWKS